MAPNRSANLRLRCLSVSLDSRILLRSFWEARWALPCGIAQTSLLISLSFCFLPSVSLLVAFFGGVENPRAALGQTLNHMIMYIGRGWIRESTFSYHLRKSITHARLRSSRIFLSPPPCLLLHTTGSAIQPVFNHNFLPANSFLIMSSSVPLASVISVASQRHGRWWGASGANHRKHYTPAGKKKGIETRGFDLSVDFPNYGTYYGNYGQSCSLPQIGRAHV